MTELIVPVAVAATMREKLCEVQEAAHPDSGLMITTPSPRFVKVPSEHTDVTMHFLHENPVQCSKDLG